MLDFRKWKKKLLLKDSDTFARIFGVLSGSSLFAHFIALAAYPIISRLYTVEAFGERAVFVSLLTLLIALVTLGYEIAINVPTAEEDVVNIIVGGFGVVLCFSTLFSLGFFLIGPTLLARMGIIGIWPYRWLIPISLLLGGAFQILQHWLFREEAYNVISRTKIWRSGTKAGIEVFAGLLAPHTWWLIIAWVLGNFSSAVRYVLIFIKKIKHSWSFNKNQIKYLLYHHRGFPIYQVGSNFIRSLFVQLPVFLFTALFTAEVTGQYAIAYAVFGVACGVIIDAYSNFHLVKLGQLLNVPDSKWRAYFWKMLLRLSLMGLGIGVGMFLLGEKAVLIIFGEQWALAGVFLQYLSFLFLSYFLYTFNFHIFTLGKKQKAHLVFNIIRLALFLGIVYSLYWETIDSISLLLLYAGVDFLINVVQLIQSYYILQSSFKYA